MGKSAGWVKEEATEVWSDKKKRWLGQRESCGSVVWWEKSMVGSKGKSSKCGLVGKNDGWVKGKATEVWSGKEKTPPGSKGKPPECGLARENCRLGQRKSRRSVV